MDGVDHTVNVSAFRKLIDACVQILALKLDKKHRNDPYTRMLWSELFNVVTSCSFSVHVPARLLATSLMLLPYSLDCNSKSAVQQGFSV